jgi:hypothetical protein
LHIQHNHLVEFDDNAYTVNIIDQNINNVYLNKSEENSNKKKIIHIYKDSYISGEFDEEKN